LPEISTPSAPPTGWYALYTSSRREKQVAKSLTERQIENFLPLYQAHRRWEKQRPTTRELPLFPNYVFVRAGRRTPLLSVPGVLSIVGNESQSWTLPNHEIEAFRGSVGTLRFEPHPPFHIGDRVRIKSGALAGMEGVLLRQKNPLRVILTIEAIRSSVAVEIDECELETADHSFRGKCRPLLGHGIATVPA
jgi:transcription antitermination factor NusG